LETLLTHWALAYGYAAYQGDFERAAEEAELAANLVPNDSWTRADLAQFLTWARRPERAIEWLEESVRRDAHPADWYFGNLGVAYYVGGRPDEAVAQFLKMKQPWRTNLMAAYVRAGKLKEAQELMAAFRRDYPEYTVEDDAVWPTYKRPQFSESVLKPYLADLAKAGLPEK